MMSGRTRPSAQRQTAMRSFAVITVHPDFIAAYARFGALSAAAAKAVASVKAIDLRDFAVDRHGSVDAPPYGGGDGMVLRPEPLQAAIASLPQEPVVILTSPAGRPWTQREAEAMAADDRPVAFICGRFAGVDQRFIDASVDAEFSCGDVVLTGGELPALMMIDSVLRLLPGVLGHGDSAVNDSFAAGCQGGLEYPLYTRPAEFLGRKVPEVLHSGDHAKISAWRQEQAMLRTTRLRPDLLVPKHRKD